MTDALLFGLIGFLVGGPLNALIDRLPPHEYVEGVDALNPRPRPLKWWELFPLLSLLGAARERRVPYRNNRLRYPAVELASAAIMGMAWSRFHEDPLTLAFVSVVGILLVALAFVDLETTYLPDKLVLPLVAGALVYAPFWPDREWWQGIAGAALGYAIFFPFAWIGDRLNRDVMGWGDVKLTAALGAALGVPFLMVGVYIGILAGGVVGLVIYAGRAFGFRRTLIPYGPYLVIGGLAAMIYGRPIIEWVRQQL